MYVTVSQAKKHLQIDETFTNDDSYILELIKVAEDAVALHLDIALDELLVDGLLPPTVVQSILLLVGNLYSNREPAAFCSVQKVPYTYEYLLGLYKHY